MSGRFTTYDIPTWAVCYFVNDDPSGLTDDEIREADEWAEYHHIMSIAPREMEPEFVPFPAFGDAGDCIVCDCMVWQ